MGAVAVVLTGPCSSTGSPVEDAAEGAFTHGHGDRCTGVNGFHAAHQTVGATHGNGTNPVITQKLLNLSGQGDVVTCGIFPLEAQGVIDLGQFPGGKFHVQNRADHLTDHTLGASRCRSCLLYTSDAADD